MHSAEASAEQQQQDMWQKELERVYQYLEMHITPDDLPLVRNAFGIGEKSRKQQWAEMACTCGSEE